jgi:hypothetical protein
MSLLAQRAQPRVKYPTDVRLFAGSRGGAPVPGRARDLGPTGIFVEAGERLAIGSAVVCEIAFPSGPLRVSGLVAREQILAQGPRDGGRVGLGIRFVNLDAAARALLEGLIPPDSRVGQLMSLQFDGLKEALRGQAAVTQAGQVGDVSVITSLPFLREGNRVQVAFLSGASKVESRGQLRDVRLAEPGEDGSPRLELQLQFGHGHQEDQHEDHDEVTEVTAVETPAGIKTGVVEDVAARDRALTQRLRKGSRIKRGLVTMPAGPARAARTAAVLAGCLFLMAVGAAVNRFGLQWNLPKPDAKVTAIASGRPIARAVPPTTIAPEPGVPAAATHTPPIVVTVEKHRPDVVPAPAAAVPAPAVKPKGPRIVSIWPPGGRAAAVAADPGTAPAAPADPAIATTATPATEPVAAAAGAAPAREAPPPESASTRETAAASGIKTLPAGTPGPQMVATGDEIVATIPLQGSTAGAVHYPLTSPHGLAVDLPRAESVLPLGRHAIFNDGFRYISIRPREGGGVRIAFTYAYFTPRLLDVTIDETSVRVRVTAPRH